MATPFSNGNKVFSDTAHQYARKLLYPKMFNCSPDDLSFEDVSNWEDDKNKILDGEMGIDDLVKVNVDGLSAPLFFTLQERWRKPPYANFRDITITEWNHATSLPSELYKINAGIFFYGYFDEDKEDFIEAIAINTTGLLHALASGSIEYKREKNPRSSQSFVCLKFDALIKAGLVVFHYNPPTQRAETR